MVTAMPLFTDSISGHFDTSSVIRFQLQMALQKQQKTHIILYNPPNADPDVV